MLDSDDEFGEDSSEQHVSKNVTDFLKELPKDIPVEKVSNFKNVSFIAEGSFGSVYKALGLNGKEVALKKLNLHHYNRRRHELALHASLQEVKVLRRLKHENVIGFETLAISRSNIYLAVEYCSILLTNLCKNTLPTAFVKAVMYQLFDGLKFIHDNDLIHRDIKTDNLMITGGLLKIADFGSCANIVQEAWTPQVVTLWYRPPELLLGSTTQTTAIDIWSVGCVLGELLLSRPLFPGHGDLSQINLIVDLLGTPTVEDWDEIESLPVLQCMSLKKRTNCIDEKFGSTEPALNLLKTLLIYDPKKRLPADKCLSDAYFSTGSEMLTEEEIMNFCLSQDETNCDKNDDRSRKKRRLFLD